MYEFQLKSTLIQYEAIFSYLEGSGSSSSRSVSHTLICIKNLGLLTGKAADIPSFDSLQK